MAAISNAVLRNVRLTARTSLGRESVFSGQMRTQGRRGFSGDHHGEQKLNFWEAPTDLNKWKEEHIVFAVVGGWAVVISSAMNYFGKKPEEGAPAAATAAAGTNTVANVAEVAKKLEEAVSSNAKADAEAIAAAIKAVEAALKTVEAK